MEPISFARGVPPTEALPVEDLADCARAAIAADGARVLNYGPVAGYEPLRQWVADRHAVDPARVLLTNGSLQAFVLLAEQLASGGRVVVEAPTYDRPLKILARLDAEPVAVGLQEDGLDVDALRRILDTGPAPAFLYTIPTFQNPSGRTLPAGERRRLVQLARECSLLIVEDDPYGLVRFEGESPPTLFELAEGEGVIFMSSFSKIVAPGLRVAYAILPPDILGAVAETATQTYLTPALVPQATIYEFLRRDLLEPSLERVRSLLRARRDAMLEALDAEFAAEASWSRPEGGYFLWLDFADGVETAAVQRAAAGEGVTFVPGADFFAGSAAGGRRGSGRTGGDGSARLAYSFASPAEIADGIRRLHRALRTAKPLAVPVDL